LIFQCTLGLSYSSIFIWRTFSSAIPLSFLLQFCVTFRCTSCKIHVIYAIFVVIFNYPNPCQIFTLSSKVLQLTPDNVVVEMLSYRAGSLQVSSPHEVMEFYELTLGAPAPGVHSASNRNYYQKQKLKKKRFLRSRRRPVKVSDKLDSICEPIVYTMWDPQHLTSLQASTVCYKRLSGYWFSYRCNS
jgi:hypothetical protein